MKREAIEKESEKWVEANIITAAQQVEILKQYPKAGKQNLFTLFAVVFFSIGILIFAISDVPFLHTYVKVVLLLLISMGLYITGSKLYANEVKQALQWKSYYGVSFIIIGYFFFGATLFVIIQDYHVQLFSIWPFIIWSIVGMILCYLFANKYILVFSMLVTLVSQLFASLSFSSFSFVILTLYLLVYMPILNKQRTKVISYFYAMGLSLQLILLTIHEAKEYYWFFIFMLAMYLLVQLIRQDILAKAFMTVSIWTMLLFRMFEAFYLQEMDGFQEIALQTSFYVILIGLFGLVILWKWASNRAELMDIILFAPVFLLPKTYLWIILVLFVYAIYWLLIGYRDHANEKMTLGIVAFVIATLTVYTQYAWDSINRSLFFMIGGVILFGLSLLLDRVRKKQLQKGEDR